MPVGIILYCPTSDSSNSSNLTIVARASSAVSPARFAALSAAVAFWSARAALELAVFAAVVAAPAALSAASAFVFAFLAAVSAAVALSVSLFPRCAA